MLEPNIEIDYLDEQYDCVVGIDEVGRGCWAGPLYLCAYVFNLSEIINGVKDSKLLSLNKREELFTKLSQHQFILQIIHPDIIDKAGLGEAMIQGLASLIENVRSQVRASNLRVLVDGYFKGEWGEDVKFVIDGDAKVYSIAAASIIAKVSRDHIMYDFAKKYPEYGFEKHVGYGTRLHREALIKYGVTEIHRKSYEPIRGMVQNKK